MIIKCFRCSKEIDTPNSTNADYIMAKDTIVEELRDTFIAIQFTEDAKKALEEANELEVATLEVPAAIKERAKARKRTPVASIEEANWLPDLEKVEVERRPTPIQKTGVICPDCYKPTDFVIWGVHKVAQ